jgi:DNA-binding IclR family transcriptional regulator
MVVIDRCVHSVNAYHEAVSETTNVLGVIARTGALLRAVAANEPDGASTTEVARVAGLARPTVHRLLAALGEEGLVDRDRKTGRWTLGPELYLLGTSAANRYDIVPQGRDIVAELARESGESAFLSARRGDETVCVYAQEGSFPLRSHVLHVGIRFPLGVASAGLAILSHLPEREADDFFSRVSPEINWGSAHSESMIRERMISTRATGYAVNPALLVEGSWGIGAAVFDRYGQPAWALSLTGVETRFRPDRRPVLGEMLLAQAHRLSLRLRR